MLGTQQPARSPAYSASEQAYLDAQDKEDEANEGGTQDEGVRSDQEDEDQLNLNVHDQSGEDQRLNSSLESLTTVASVTERHPDLFGDDDSDPEADPVEDKVRAA